MPKAIETWSQAIRTALNQYNAAAQKPHPPCPILDWETVIEYAFLAEFNLLRDSHQDIRKEIWATPVGHKAMDQYFKIECAKEKIEHLNVEIWQLVTYMEDEDAFLLAREREVIGDDPHLAFQIRQHRREHSRYKELHWRQLKVLERQKGFTGTLLLGKGERSMYHLSSDVAIPNIEEDSEDDKDDEDEGDVEEALENFLRVAVDTT